MSRHTTSTAPSTPPPVAPSAVSVASRSKPAAAEPRFADIAEHELDALIGRVEEARDHGLALSAVDLGLLLNALLTLANVAERLEHDDLTIARMRKLLGIVRSSEKLRDLTGVRDAEAGDDAANADGRGADGGGDAAADDGAQPAKPGSTKGTRRPRPKPKPAKPEVHHHLMTDLARGDACPGCHAGSLHKYAPSEFTRIRGHSPFSAERHVSEQLRCSGCGEIHRAPLPSDVLADGAAGQKYGHSARSAMSIAKYFGGEPFFRQQTVQGLFGVSLSASTIFEQCEQLSDALNPVYRALQRAAAAAALFYLDDTTHRILEAKPVEKTRNGVTRLRTGVYASAVLAIAEEQRQEAAGSAGRERRIVLFQTNVGHAGEWMDEILFHRPEGLGAPLVMSDALSSNAITTTTVRRGLCNAHARRGFVEVAASYPDEALFALETYQTIWAAERHCIVEGLDPEARLAWHRTHSAGPMAELRHWCEQQLASGAVEQNSTLGGAMRYLVRHFDGLTLFLREPGAPVDNNEIERLIKLVVRGFEEQQLLSKRGGSGRLGRDHLGAGDVPRERGQRVRVPERGAATPDGGARRAGTLAAVELPAGRRRRRRAGRGRISRRGIDRRARHARPP